MMQLICVVVLMSVFFLFYYLPIGIRFHLQWLQGLMLNLLIFCFALFLTRQVDIRNDRGWFGTYLNDSSAIIVKLTEPPVEKAKSFKATATVQGFVYNGRIKNAKGKLLIYFSKEELSYLPAYGDHILITNGISEVKNAGNPGAFDYKRYLCFQQTFHQAFLKNGDYRLVKKTGGNPFYRFIFLARTTTIGTLQRYIRGDKKVTGIAEALLIGYKENLDKETVQEYSNTGVVHIIAISGMHLGLIYVVLVWIFSRVPLIKNSTVVKVALILTCLWLFSLLTGASASVLRSAVMFTCIITGKSFFKGGSMYNSLAASAFLLLCYDPFLLWDVGFQLSYCAVIGIVWLQKPFSDLLYIANKYRRKLWEMCTVTMAAQVLTLPVCLYYFHQFPTTFLFTNLFCVPLSTVVLFGEILLILLSFAGPIAAIIGKCVYILIWLMNFIVRTCNRLPFSVVENIYTDPFTTVLLYLFVISLISGLLYKKKKYLRFAAGSLIILAAFHGYEKIKVLQQKKIVIYQINRHTAIDFITGNTFAFYGDEACNKDAALYNYHLKPARIALQATDRKDDLNNLSRSGRIWQFYHKTILIIDSTVRFENTISKIKTDVLLIRGNPKLNLADITSAVRPAVVVIDGSNSLWKIGQWKKECEQLHLPCHIIPEKGAFILNANDQ